MKEPKYGEVSSMNLERVKCYISEGLDNFISSWCCKNNVDKSFSLVRANNFKNKNGEKTVKKSFIWQMIYIQINIQITY